MPIYSYRCNDCGSKEQIDISMSEYQEKFMDNENSLPCTCGLKKTRVIGAITILGMDSKTGIKAWGVAPPPNSDKVNDKF